jgi:hypothetical protein
MKTAPFHPVVFHIIRTTAQAGATPKAEWRMSAALHEVMVKMRFSFVHGAA